MFDKLLKFANHLDNIGLTKEADYLDHLMSHTDEPSKGDHVKNINPGCTHFGSEGVVEDVSSLPGDKGVVVVYVVTNDGEAYSKGDTLEKTLDQLMVV
tara:strand:- start:9942 stop:10235 length:294 start_codon:yes stop_codon:yes gene_type:complete